MAVSVSNLVVNQNSDYNLTISLEDSYGNPLNLTDCTAIGKIKKYYGSNKYFSFNISFSSPLTSGNISISLDKNTTKKMEIGRYLYDIKITDSNNKTTKVLEGIVTVNGGIS